MYAGKLGKVSFFDYNNYKKTKTKNTFCQQAYRYFLYIKSGQKDVRPTLQAN